MNLRSSDFHEREALVQEVKNACINVGFFYGSLLQSDL